MNRNQRARSKAIKQELEALRAFKKSAPQVRKAECMYIIDSHLPAEIAERALCEEMAHFIYNNQRMIVGGITSELLNGKIMCRLTAYIAIKKGVE